MARWKSCNILHVADNANRLWQFDAKGGGVVMSREQNIGITEPLPARSVGKSWSSFWQPKLNVAWLPVEHVFLRLVELPVSDPAETQSMVELQLEKLSPIPVAQIVWTYHVLPPAPTHHRPEPEPLLGGENAATPGVPLQTIIVVIAPRNIVEEFLGKLEDRGFMADRLEIPFLDQLSATPSHVESTAWIYPLQNDIQNAALVAWWGGGSLRNLSLIKLPANADRVAGLAAQLGQLVWAGEMEGWLAETPRWHLVAGPVEAAEWEPALRQAIDQPVPTQPPLSPVDVAARTAFRSAAANGHPGLLPAEFSQRYHQQFVDRLWLHALLAAGVAYAIGVVIYMAALQVLDFKTAKVEQQVASIANTYTNALQIKAQYEVLKERETLKYAALDCWKVTAEHLPEDITLQRFSFGGGRTLALSGTAKPDQVNTLLDFNTAMQKATLNGQPVFDPMGGEPVSPRFNGGVVSWSFSLRLRKTEDLP